MPSPQTLQQKQRLDLRCWPCNIARFYETDSLHFSYFYLYQSSLCSSIINKNVKQVFSIGYYNVFVNGFVLHWKIVQNCARTVLCIARCARDGENDTILVTPPRAFIWLAIALAFTIASFPNIATATLSNVATLCRTTELWTPSLLQHLLPPTPTSI